MIAQPSANGRLARAVRRVAAASARRPKTTIALWLLLVVGCVAGGSLTGTQQLRGADAGVGQSATADHRLAAAGLADPAVESILIRAADPQAASTAARALETRARALPEVRAVRGPTDTPALSTAGGRSV